MGETIVVTEFAWLENQPAYPRGSKDPATFGNQHTFYSLVPQAVALKYAPAEEFNAMGIAQNTLAEGFHVRTEPCVVILTKRQLVQRGQPGQQRNYDSLSITVKSSTFPDGIRVNDRLITPEINTRPKPGTVLLLRLITIEPETVTQFGQDLFAPKLEYPTGKLLVDKMVMVEYLTSHLPTKSQ